MQILPKSTMRKWNKELVAWVEKELEENVELYNSLTHIRKLIESERRNKK